MEDHIINRSIIIDNELVANHQILLFIRLDCKACERSYYECREQGILSSIKVINCGNPNGKKIFDDLIGKGSMAYNIFPYWYSLVSKKIVIGYKPAKMAINDLLTPIYANI